MPASPRSGLAAGCSFLGRSAPKPCWSSVLPLSKRALLAARRASLRRPAAELCWYDAGLVAAAAAPAAAGDGLSAGVTAGSCCCSELSSTAGMSKSVSGPSSKGGQAAIPADPAAHHKALIVVIPGGCCSLMYCCSDLQRGSHQAIWLPLVPIPDASAATAQATQHQHYLVARVLLRAIACRRVSAAAGGRTVEGPTGARYQCEPCLKKAQPDGLMCSVILLC